MQFRQRRTDYNNKVDIFSFIVVVFEMITPQKSPEDVDAVIRAAKKLRFPKNFHTSIPDMVSFLIICSLNILLDTKINLLFVHLKY